MSDTRRTVQRHPIAPVWDETSRILILGQLSVGQIQRSQLFLRASAEPFLARAGRRTRLR